MASWRSECARCGASQVFSLLVQYFTSTDLAGAELSVGRLDYN